MSFTIRRSLFKRRPVRIAPTIFPEEFRTGIATGQRLVRALRGRISGLCQPTYVLDIPGGYGKVPIAPCAVSTGPGSCGWSVEDPAGVQHTYPPDPEG